MILFRADAILASSNSKFWKFFPETDREVFLTRPMNQPSPLLRSITLLPVENQNKQSLDVRIVFSTPRMIVDQGICRIATPTLAVFAVQPQNCAGIPPVLTK